MKCVKSWTENRRRTKEVLKSSSRRAGEDGGGSLGVDVLTPRARATLKLITENREKGLFCAGLVQTSGFTLKIWLTLSQEWVSQYLQYLVRRILHCCTRCTVTFYRVPPLFNLINEGTLWHKLHYSQNTFKTWRHDPLQIQIKFSKGNYL